MGYRNYSVANGFTVDKLGNGDFTTIQAAITAAVSPQTIFIRPGTYTENPTMKAGVNLTAFTCDAPTPNVTIVGELTASYSGTAAISGIQLKTNSAPCLHITGSTSPILYVRDCFIIAANNTAVSHDSTGSGYLEFYNCEFNSSTTGVSPFAITPVSGAPDVVFIDCRLYNDGASATAATCAAGNLQFFGSEFSYLLSISGASTTLNIFHSTFFGDAIGTLVALATGTNGTISNSYFQAGAASSVMSITSTGRCIFTNSTLNSSATNVITGTGMLSYSGLTFTGSSANINVTNQTGGTLSGSTFQNPSAGFLGESITSGFVSGTNLPNNTPENLASIALTAGVWDISGIGSFIFTGTAGAFILGVSANSGSFTGTNEGDTSIQINLSNSVSPHSAGTIPAVRVVLSSSATYYLVGEAFFSSGAASGNGRISAVRVG